MLNCHLERGSFRVPYNQAGIENNISNV